MIHTFIKSVLYIRLAYTPLIQLLLFSVIDLRLPYLRCLFHTYSFVIIAIFNILFNILLLTSPWNCVLDFSTHP